ncbi:Alpha/Beta hydrolase protein [Aspergillus cavernicola]|uniref:Carboxylic ester hydrolase n=1 Tax=Aspergillus cavernicola TaxID=176166 RepID=A0ABR4ISB3_9EURO
MRFEYLILQLLSLSILSQSASITAQTQPVVNINNGTFIGTRNSEFNQEFFLGIPYAQPPVGNLRFNHPQPINQSWSEKQATAYGPWCHSTPLSLPGFTQTGFDHDESEDCLTLNVVRPRGVDSDARLPVLVWIYGGGFAEGGSADQRYNMSFLVQESVQMGQPTIGVSFNYRLSGFGFLLGRAVNESGVANIGLYDQRLALHWIQENILAFGGDPSRVTIQGESAGAVSVGHHFLAYGGRDDGLFHAGIAESGGPLTTRSLISLDEQDTIYNGVLNSTNCTDTQNTLQCLRSKPANTLKAAFQGVNFFPVLDGGIIMGTPSVALREGHFVKRPLLIGTNTNEGTAFSYASGRGVNNSAEFRAMIIRYSGGDNGLKNTTVDALLDHYLNRISSKEAQADLGTVLLSPSPEYGALWGRVTLYAGDYQFNAGRRYTTQLWDRYGVPAYSYRFDAVPNGIPRETLGATHFQEVSFVFRNFDGVGYQVNPLASTSTELQQNYRDLSKLMSQMWLNFANTLSPNAHRGKLFLLMLKTDPQANLTWPVYRNENATNIVFHLNGTHLEPDNWRSNAIGRLIGSLPEFQL